MSPQNPLVPAYSGAVAAWSLRYTLRSATAFTVIVQPGDTSIVAERYF